MVKYHDFLLTFTEVPDEISLCINCTCCPLKCKNCFEPWLQDDCGKQLSTQELDLLIEKSWGISCVCFMGGINDYRTLADLMKHVKEKGLKVAIYSGHNHIDSTIEPFVDYYKVGPFIPERGGMNKKTTNQKFLKKKNNSWIDITYRFQKERA